MIRIEKYSEYIKKNKIDNLFSSQQWLGVLENEYQFDFFVAYETTSDSYLPFTKVNDLKGGG